MRNTASLLAVAILCFFATTARADSIVTYTEDGIDFTLKVQELPGSMVTADLILDTTSYVGSAFDALHAVSIKVVNSWSSFSLEQSPAGTWLTKTGGATNNTIHPGNDTAPGTGWVTAYYDGQTGPAMDGSEYEFQFKFNDAGAPLEAYGIKGLTVWTNDMNLMGTKAQQWSSGDLIPEWVYSPSTFTLTLTGGGGPGSQSIAEASTLLLIVAGIGLFLLRRR